MVFAENIILCDIMICVDHKNFTDGKKEEEAIYVGTYI